MEELGPRLASIPAVGIACLWLAARLRIPAILLLMAIMKDGRLDYRPAPDRARNKTKTFRFFDWLLKATLKLTKLDGRAHACIPPHPQASER